MQDNIYLKATEITKSYQLEKLAVPVLKGVNLSVNRGECLALLGASGSGKTTLLNIIGLLEKPISGTVDIYQDSDPVNILALKKKQKAKFLRDNIGFIFQAFHLLPELNVLENIMLPGMINFTFGKQLKETVEELAEKAGLSHRLNHRPNELSGGEQQRVAIIRALVNSPELILADEPTGNLDSVTGGEILEIFTELREIDKSRTIIMVTHDQNVAKIADRVIRLQDGVIAQE